MKLPWTQLVNSVVKTVSIGFLSLFTVHSSNYSTPTPVYTKTTINKKLSYCWETVRRESMPRIAEMDVEMTT